MAQSRVCYFESLFFFFDVSGTIGIYTLSLHELFRSKSAVETLSETRVRLTVEVPFAELKPSLDAAYRKVAGQVDRKSTRLNSSHSQISYAVFCLKKKNKNKNTTIPYT